MKAYQYLARMFKEYGTTHLFFQELMFMKTIKEAEELGIKAILAHSEFAAGYMADGYARVKKAPGICMSQSIGSANLAASIHDAWLGTTPVIAFTGKKTPAFQYRGAYQESPHMPFFSGLTKLNVEVADPSLQLPMLVRQAYKEATTGKPRPVHLDIYGFFGLETEDMDIPEDFVVNPEYGHFPAIRPYACEKTVEKAAEAIGAATKPLLIVGRGALQTESGDILLQLAEKIDAWIVTTPDGKTIIDESHPRWGGVVGGYGIDSANKLASSCDLAIFIGTQASDQSTLDWTAPRRTVKAIQIDIDPAELGRNYQNCIGLCGDAGKVMEQLVTAVSAAKRDGWKKEGDAYVADTNAMRERMWSDSSEPIRTERLCYEVGKALPDDAILVADTGWSAVWSANMIPMKQSQFYMRAAGSLGWSFPASLGAKCAAPDRPVINFLGDGAFLYLNTEMETAVRYGINTVTVINNNNALAQCVPFEAGWYGKDENMRCINKLSFTGPHFANIAAEYGLFAKRVEKPEDIQPALQAALASGRPALVEVMTESNDNLPPPSWK